MGTKTFEVIVVVIDIAFSFSPLGWRSYWTAATVVGFVVAVLNMLLLLAILGQVHI